MTEFNDTNLKIGKHAYTIFTSDFDMFMALKNVTFTVKMNYHYYICLVDFFS